MTVVQKDKVHRITGSSVLKKKKEKVNTNKINKFPAMCTMINAHTLSCLLKNQSC